MKTPMAVPKATEWGSSRRSRIERSHCRGSHHQWIRLLSEIRGGGFDELRESCSTIASFGSAGTGWSMSLSCRKGAEPRSISHLCVSTLTTKSPIIDNVFDVGSIQGKTLDLEGVAFVSQPASDGRSRKHRNTGPSFDSVHWDFANCSGIECYHSSHSRFGQSQISFQIVPPRVVRFMGWSLVNRNNPNSGPLNSWILK